MRSVLYKLQPLYLKSLIRKPDTGQKALREPQPGPAGRDRKTRAGLSIPASSQPWEL